MPRFCAHPALRSRVVSIDVVEADGGTSFVLPSTSIVLGFQFRGRVRAGEDYLALAGVTGIQASAKTYSYEANTGSVLVRFTPAGAACLGLPAAELTGRSVALDAILPRARVAQVHEELGAAGDTAARIAVVARWLTEFPFEDDALVTRATTLLSTTHDEPSVSAVAMALGVSERQLERRFTARVGVSPKRFVTLRRFELAIAGATSAPSLTVAALDAGYYDQSHFIRDFRRFAGTSPRKYLMRSR
ncbi:MAG TPA: helix-turn-helix domain-containing protein [Polyangiaceae bacterium]|nr:helix-turn-helix domain-containing protein [Polyangiaceae bacterium]